MLHPVVRLLPLAAAPLLLVALPVLPRSAAAQCPPVDCSAGAPHICKVGLVNNDQIWDDTVRPYLVTGDLTIRPWATLTIRPGVEVRFATCDEQAGGEDAARVELIALGTLLVQGTAEDPVVLRSAAANGAPGHWYGLLLRTELHDGNAGASQIRNAVITHAVHGIYSQSVLPSSIRDSEIHSGSGHGIYWQSAASPSISGCEVHDNGGAGIRLENSSGELISATISRSLVYDNHDQGLSVGPDISVTIERNRIFGNGAGGLRLEDAAAGQVVNNFIYANGGSGIRLAQTKDRTLTVDHNTIHASSMPDSPARPR